MSRFVDLVRIQVISGDGGNGMVAWRREKYEPLGGPAGGTGGRGGSVYLQSTSDMNTLLDFQYKHEFKAQPGHKGGPKKQSGRHGQDLIIKVPLGTLVRDAEDGQIIADLTDNEQKVLVAEGGRGGRGNSDLSTHRNRAPHFCEPGEVGIARELELELKLLADVGIVGLPNAGKSSLLSVLTAARPKIADYPFSTLKPNLGVVASPSGDGFVMADVPGLVSGASNNVGLGHQFLRHLERTRVIIHLADISDPELDQNIATIGKELGLYSQTLERLPQMVVLNKADLMDAKEAQQIAKKVSGKLKKLLPNARLIHDIHLISCATTMGLDELRNQLAESLAQIPKEEPHEVKEDFKARLRLDDGFHIERKKRKFYVSGTRLERMVNVTNMRSPEALLHLWNVLNAMGVVQALIEAGAEPGCDVVIGDAEFTFGQFG